MIHSPGFLKVVNEARPRIRELTVEEVKGRLARNPGAVLMDVREDLEWALSHVKGAVHLGKGILERDIERTVPDVNTEILMYCGGGYRSVLTADAARRMGYQNVYSVIGGFKALSTDGWPMEQGMGTGPTTC